MPAPLLFGPVSIDRWVDEGLDLPGGGVFNIAVQWARAGMPFRLLSRIGHDDGAVIQVALARHHIDALPSLVQPGRTATIDVTIRADRQPWMDHFDPGVWAEVTLTDDDVAALRAAGRVHAVMVDPVIRSLTALHDDGGLDGVEVSLDLLDMRHLDDERTDRLLAIADLAFIGWQGAEDDPRLERIATTAAAHRTLVIVTLGSAGMLALDGRDGTRVRHHIKPLAVLGTTVGCGDAFAGGFLRSWWRDAPGDIDAALAAGAAEGAAATEWVRPLPDQAYGIQRTS